MLHVTHGLPRKMCRYMSIMIEHAMAPRKRMRNKQIDCSLPVHRDSHSVSHERELYLTTHAALRSMYSCVLSKAPPPGALGVTLNVTTCTQGPTSSRCLSREKSVAVLRLMRQIHRGATTPDSTLRNGNVRPLDLPQGRYQHRTVTFI